MSTTKPHVKGAILCDDVRTEFNGKHIIIGVYGPDVGLLEIPGVAKLHMAVLIDLPDAGEFDFKLRVLDNKRETVIETHLTVGVERSGANLLIPGLSFAINVKEAGTICLQSFDEDWHDVGSWFLQKVEASDIPPDPHLMK